MKIINHGKTVVKVVARPEIQAYVDDSKLADLCRISYSTVDKGLLSAFTERWQPDTSSFHLPVGEITLTLDDVSQLLHIPVRGTFFTMPDLSRTEAAAWLHTLLGVPMPEARQQTDKGPVCSLMWLRDEVYPRCCRDEQWDRAARAFLLHLVGSTIFANKSQSRTRVAYLDMFRDLTSVGNYAWGAMALVFMYDQLREASRRATRQLAGYATLLQVRTFMFYIFLKLKI